MCRASLEGGRRCPHDSSAARHARRIAQNYGNYPTLETVKNKNSVTPNSVEKYETITEGHQQVNKTIKDAKKQVETKPKVFIAEDGETFNNVYDFLKHTGVILERKATKLGATIVHETEKTTGVRFDTIVEEYNMEAARLSTEVDSLMEQEALLKNRAAELLNVSPQEGFIFDKLRLFHANNPDNVDAEKLKQEIDSLADRKTLLDREMVNLNHGYTEPVRVKYEQNIKTLLSLMKTVRSFGGDIIVSEKSEKTRINILNQAAQYYPTEWLEQSNHNPVRLVVKKTNGRAHYTHWSKTAKVSPLYKIMSYDTPPEDMEEVITVKADKNGYIKYSNDKIDVHIDGHHYAPNETVYITPQWEYPNPWNTRYNSDGSPKGYGWKPYIHHHTGSTAWRRIIRQRTSSVDKTSANILVDRMVNHVNKVEGFDSAIHELAHRMEAVEVPFLKHVQKAFYERRTTNPDGTKQQPVKLYKGRKEYSTPDSFAADYMGKTYSGDTHYEILSTGMEAIFGGEYAGGLIGLKNKKADKDMFNFIIGTLSSV